MDENIANAPTAGPFEILIMLGVALLMIIPFWRILSKAGFPGWLSIFIAVPLANFILVYFLAFARWPNLKERDNDQITRTTPPTTPT